MSKSKSTPKSPAQSKPKAEPPKVIDYKGNSLPKLQNPTKPPVKKK